MRLSGGNVTPMLLDKSLFSSKWWFPRSGGVLLALLVVLAFDATVAFAAPPGPNALPVAVVAVKSDDALDQAEALTQAIRKAVRDSEGWSLAEGNQSLEFLALQLKCSDPIDAACEARVADVIKADRFLWSVIQLSQDEKVVQGGLNFFVRGKGTNKVALNYSANLTEATGDALVKVASDAVVKVLGGTPKGGLKVTTTGVASQLYVDGKPYGPLPSEGTTIQLAAGAHRIQAKAPGYADAELTVVVKPVSTVEVALVLEPVEESEPIDGRMIGGFAGLGLGLAAGAVGLWGALDVNRIQGDSNYINYQKGWSTTTDVCEQARADKAVTTVVGAGAPSHVAGLCDEAEQAELMQAIAFPVAAVAAGLGAYLLGTSSLVGGADEAGEDEKASAWSVEPYVGPELQHVQMTYRF